MVLKAGFRSFNGPSKVQIDQDYRNLMLISRAAIQALPYTEPGYSQTHRVQVSVTAELPLVAIRPRTEGVPFGLFQVVKNGNVITFDFYGMGSSIVDVYIFGEAPAIVTYGGMTIWREDGSVAFDSGNRYANVRDLLISANYADMTGTHTYESGRTYAIAFSTYSGNKQVNSIPNSPFCGGITEVREAKVYTAAQTLPNGFILGTGANLSAPRCTNVPPISSTIYFRKAQYLILDVTGY